MSIISRITDRFKRRPCVEANPEGEGVIGGRYYQAPHCDENVLHAPGECEYCDYFPEAQQRRIKLNVNFTGEGDPAKLPCPAQVRRPLETINRWGGNVPTKRWR